MPTISVYIKERIYKIMMREYAETGLTPAKLIQLAVEAAYNETAAEEHRETIYSGVRPPKISVRHPGSLQPSNRTDPRTDESSSEETGD